MNEDQDLSTVRHFDCLIIGGGPGGLTAALTLARQRHSVAVFDSGKYRNSGVPYMHMLPTWDHTNPADFRAAAREELLKNYRSVTIFDELILTVKNNGASYVKDRSCFELETESKTTYYGAKLILGSGCRDILPDIPGFADAWPTSIFHCLFCHGYEDRGSESSGVLAIGAAGGNPPGALHAARNALQLTERVVIYTNGMSSVSDDIKTQLGAAGSRVAVDTRKIVLIEKTANKAEVNLHFEDGKMSKEAFLTNMPMTTFRGDFVEQLGLDIEMGNVAITSMFNETSVRGVFAVGDIINHQKIFSQAIWSGCSAGAGVAVQLQADDWGHKPIVGH